MKTSESIKNVAMSFVKVSNLVKNMIPDSKGYGYNYTSLGPIIDQIKPILLSNGLCVIQSPAENENSLAIETVILHESGEYFSFIYNISATNMKGANNTQQEGAAISYGRRYALSAIFGIATETDTDAHTKEVSNPIGRTPPVTIGKDPFKEPSLKDQTKELSQIEKFKQNIIGMGKNPVLKEFEKTEYRGRFKTATTLEALKNLSAEMEVAIKSKEAR